MQTLEALGQINDEYTSYDDAMLDAFEEDMAFDGPLCEEIARYDVSPIGGDACRY